MTMNLERMDILADALDHANDPPEGVDKFNQGLWRERKTCGTIGCVAGWTCALFDKPWWLKLDEGGYDKCRSDEEDGLDVQDKATELLGLSDSQAIWLFHGVGCRDFYNGHLSQVPATVMATQVRLLAAVERDAKAKNQTTTEDN